MILNLKGVKKESKGKLKFENKENFLDLQNKCV